jgi:hypothetical protein
VAEGEYQEEEEVNGCKFFNKLYERPAGKSPLQVFFVEKKSSLLKKRVLNLSI